MPGMNRVFRVPGTPKTQSGQGLFRVFRVCRAPARTCTHTNLAHTRAHAYARIYPEHPEHPEQSRCGAAFGRSGYL